MRDDEVRDRLAIHELYGRYVIGIDGEDPDFLGRCFTADAVFEHRAGKLVGRAAIAALATEYTAKGADRALHFCSGVTILTLDCKGGSATGTAHWMASRPSQPDFSFGIYTDVLRREDDGEWRLKERMVRHLRVMGVAR